MKHSSAVTNQDDLLTLSCLGALAYIVADVLHEALGHGTVALLMHAHTLTLSTVALSSDVAGRWLAAAGMLVNLAAGILLWLLLRRPRFSPATRFFLWALMAQNLLDTGYLMYSGFSNYGDWAQVIAGMQPGWAWRSALVLGGLAIYLFVAYAMVAPTALRCFFGNAPADSARLHRLFWTPYFAAGAISVIAGAFNPIGAQLIALSAAASSFGGASALLWLPGVLHNRTAKSPEDAANIGWTGPVIRRSWPWIAVSAIASLVFVFVLGRGITWHPF
jgi:hypothetical protein